MSILTNPLQSGLLLQQAVLPYTFTTGELDSLKAKLQAAENQMMQTPNKQASMLPMSAAEIRTLLRMIDMTYLQGLSGSGHYVQDCTGATTTMNPMLHNQQQLLTTHNMNTNQLLSSQPQHQQSINTNGLNSLNTNGLNGLNTNSMNGMNTNQLLQASASGLNNINNINNLNNMNMNQQQLLSQSSIKNPPPANYVCHKCNIVGHWIQECPLNTQTQQDYTKPPPANYICHRCGVPGHWIKNCPTNGNPTFDNKPHLKVMKTDGQNVNIQSQSNNSNNNNDATSTVSQSDNNSTNATTAQPPSKKRRLNQM